MQVCLGFVGESLRVWVGFVGGIGVCMDGRCVGGVCGWVWGCGVWMWGCPSPHTLWRTAPTSSSSNCSRQWGLSALMAGGASWQGTAPTDSRELHVAAGSRARLAWLHRMGLPVAHVQLPGLGQSHVPPGEAPHDGVSDQALIPVSTCSSQDSVRVAGSRPELAQHLRLYLPISRPLPPVMHWIVSRFQRAHWTTNIRNKKIVVVYYTMILLEDLQASFHSSFSFIFLWVCCKQEKPELGLLLLAEGGSATKATILRFLEVQASCFGLWCQLQTWMNFYLPWRWI